MGLTKIMQGQLELGSETAVDLLAMQNGWKKEMITAMNNKIANYASDADTMNTVVQKFMGMTGGIPDTVYKVFKAVNSGGPVMPRMSTMPTTSNDSWEITLCQKFKQQGNDVLINLDAISGIYLHIEIEEHDHVYNGYACARVPVYNNPDESQELEWLELNTDPNSNIRHAFLPNVKYWIKFGYGDGKYYCRVSTNGDADNPTYETAFEITSSRKTQCKGLPATSNTPYLAIFVGALGDPNINNGNILWLKECKVVIDGQTIFDGDDDSLVMGTDITWNATQVCYLVDAIQL